MIINIIWRYPHAFFTPLVIIICTPFIFLYHLNATACTRIISGAIQHGRHYDFMYALLMLSVPASPLSPQV